MHTNTKPARSRSQATRLVAFCAGVAATLAGGFFNASTGTEALEGAVASSFMPIAPCRLLDTRPDTNVGPRSTPIGPGETYVVKADGLSGNCAIEEATGLALNATAVNATADSFLTLFPADGDLPLSSNLNFVAGQPPTPNKVDVGLSDTGEIAIFNQFGSVDVVIDVTGYYSNEQIGSMQNQLNGLSGALNRMAVMSNHVGSKAITDDPTTVVSLTIPSYMRGGVMVQSWMTPGALGAGYVASCSITDGSTVDPEARQIWESQSMYQQGTLSASRVFPLPQGKTLTVQLVCQHEGAGTSFGIENAELSAIVLPNYYEYQNVAAAA